MNTHSKWVICVAAAFLITCAGCEGPTRRLNAPPQGCPMEPSDLQEYYTFMVDNAMLHDMCIADIHFVPHMADVNGLGVRRLGRYSELLRGHGGTIHLETTSTDDELTEARLGKVNDFLAASGLDMANVTVKLGLPRGRPVEAVDAIRIEEEGTVNDYGTSSGSFGGS